MRRSLRARAPTASSDRALFRSVNEEIARLDGNGTTLFLRECGNPACSERIPLTAAALRQLHNGGNLFVVLSGHATPDVESVVDESDSYVIVRKSG